MQPDTIQPAETQSFKLTFLNVQRSSMITSYGLNAESHQYTSVPEFPWLAIVPLAALTLASVAMPRRQGPNESGPSRICRCRTPIRGVPPTRFFQIFEARKETLQPLRQQDNGWLKHARDIVHLGVDGVTNRFWQVE
jgi:hypothetical protein